MTKEQFIKELEHIAESGSNEIRLGNLFDLVISQDRESRWISVEERLPEPKEQVLVYQPPKKWSNKDEMTKGRVLIGYMFRLPQDERGTWIDLNELNDKACSLRQGGLFWAFPYICHQNFVTHWQPLPEPPKTLTP